MTPSGFNKERRRTKATKRVGWASALIRPRTLKVLIAVGQPIAVMLRVAIEVIRFFRE